MKEGLNGVNRQPSNGKKSNRQPSKMDNFNRQPSTVNRQTVRKVTVNCQKWIILTVNRQLNQEKLAVKSLEYLLPRTIIASNNGVKYTISLYFPNKLKYWNFSLVRNSSDFRLETLPGSKNISYLLILL